MNGNSPNKEPQPAAELQGVWVCAGGRWIIREVNVAIPAGVCCAMVGPNGCGKSTLARVLAGFVWPTKGCVRVLGETFGETDLHALRRQVKLVQATGTIEFDPSISAADAVLTGAFGTILLHDVPTPEHRARAEELMRRLRVEHLAVSRFGTLSTGERMRVLLARALLIPPTLLLLDEPTAGLDVPGRELLLDGLDQIMSNSPGRPTILQISHHLEELPICTDWAILMREGVIGAAGPAGQVLADGPMSQAFGIALRIERRNGRFAARTEKSVDGAVFG